MEKRVLLAFALSMAVFFIYSQYFAPRPMAPRPPEASAPITAPTEKAPSAAVLDTPARADVAPLTVAPQAETSVTLRNALVDATFSTRRGLTHWILQNYRRAPGDDAPLVDLAQSAGVAVGFDLSLIPNTTPANFSIQGRATDSVTMAAQLSPTFIESRTWRIKGYIAELEWRGTNQGSKAMLINPTIVLAEGLNYATMLGYEVHGPIVARGDEIERPSEDEILKKLGFNSIKWAGLNDKYFLKAVVPPSGMRDVNATVSELSKKDDLAMVAVNVALPDQVIAPGEQWSTKMQFYLGPKASSELTTAGAGLEKSIDYGFFEFLSKPLLALIKLFQHFIGNYGIAIILVTILIKLLFYPLTRKSFTAMRDMQRMQPKLEALKKKYEKDKERLNKEMMALYRTEGINPLGGCLPMVLQIPVFFALYQVLLNAIELRHAPFIFWINDLSSPEDLYTLTVAGFDLPLRLLPLVMGITMMLQQKMTPSSMDKAQQQIMMIMPVMFTFMFWGFPSGLVLYWLVNNVISISQQWWMINRTKSAA